MVASRGGGREKAVAGPVGSGGGETPDIPADRGRRAQGFVHALVDSPFAGILPWVVMSVISGPGRFEIATGLALALSLVFLVISHHKGSRLKAFEVFDLAFFAAFFALGFVVGTEGRTWLETWGGEVSNIALVAFVAVTLAIRHPFTLAYARETTPREYWGTPAFRSINDAITWVWLGAFVVQASFAYVGNLLDTDAANFWLGWIIPLAAIVQAVVFTEMWPDRVRGRARGDGSAPPLWHLFTWIPTFAAITGIVGFITDGSPVAVNVVLIVGGVLSGILIAGAARRSPDRTRVSA